MSETNKAIVRRFFETANAGNIDQWDEILVEDYVHHDPQMPPEMQRGRDNYKQGISGFLSAFPDGHLAVEDLIAEGDRVVSRIVFNGTHNGDLMGIPPSGKPVTFNMIGIWRIAGGRIAEGWVNFDILGVMQQIGVIPEQG